MEGSSFWIMCFRYLNVPHQSNFFLISISHPPSPRQKRVVGLEKVLGQGSVQVVFGGAAPVSLVGKDKKVIAELAIRADYLPWNPNEPRGGIVFDPKTSLPHTDQEHILRIVTSADRMSVSVHGPVAPQLVLLLAKLFKGPAPVPIVEAGGVLGLTVAHVSERGFPSVQTGIFSSSSNDEREIALAVLTCKVSALLLSLGYVELRPCVWVPREEGCDVPQNVSPEFVYGISGSVYYVWSRAALPTDLVQIFQDLGSNLEPIHYAGDFGMQAWKAPEKKGLSSVVRKYFLSDPSMFQLSSPKVITRMLVKVDIPAGEQPDGRRQGFRHSQFKRGSTFLGKSGASVPTPDQQQQQKQAPKYQLSRAQTKFALQQANCCWLSLSIDDNSGLVSDFKAHNMKPVDVAHLLEKVPFAEGCAVLDDGELTLVTLHESPLWKRFCWKGNGYLIPLKRAMFLTNFDRMAAQGYAMTKRLADLNVQVKFRKQTAPPAHVPQHIIVSLETHVGKGLVLHVVTGYSDDPYLSRLKSTLKRASPMFKAGKVIDLGWGPCYLEFEVPGSDIVSAQYRALHAVDQVMGSGLASVGGGSSGSHHQEKPAVVQSRAISMFVALIEALVIHLHFDIHLATWLSEVANRIEEMSFLFARQAEADSRGELPKDASTVPVLSCTNPDLFVESSKLRWEMLAIAEVLMKTIPNDQPHTGFRLILLISSGKYTDFYGRISREEMERLAQKVRGSKLIEGHDSKKGHLCWSLQWVDSGNTDMHTIEATRTHHLLLHLTSDNRWSVGGMPAKFPNTVFMIGHD